MVSMWGLFYNVTLILVEEEVTGLPDQFSIQQQSVFYCFTRDHSLTLYGEVSL